MELLSLGVRAHRGDVLHLVHVLRYVLASSSSCKWASAFLTIEVVQGAQLLMAVIFGSSDRSAGHYS